MNSATPSTIPTAAPSAAPATATPAAPVAAATPALSAAESDPNNLAYYDRLASQSLQTLPATSGNGSPPAVAPAAPPAAPVPTSVQTPGLAAPAATAPTAPDPNPPPPAAPAAPAAEEGEESLPTAEEQAAMSPSEQRIYGALQKERQARKEAKAELKQQREQFDALKQEIDTLKAKNNPDPNKPAAPAPTPAATPAMPGPLGDCTTFEAVDARVMQAATHEAKADRLLVALSMQQTNHVVEALKKENMTHLNGIPLAEASAEQLGEFLASVKEGAKMTQLSAEPHKRFLVNQANSWNEATKLLPELLKDPKNVRTQQFLRMATPAVRAMGPNWPMLVAQQVLGAETAARMATPPPAPAIVPQVAPIPTATVQPPAAPRVAPAAGPQASELDQLRVKMEKGTATNDEVDRYAVLSLRAGAPAQA